MFSQMQQFLNVPNGAMRKLQASVQKHSRLAVPLNAGDARV